MKITLLAVTWDLEYDVVIGGYGYAGATAAIAAHDAGSYVGLFEKMPRPGGNSILSGGSCLVAKNVAGASSYMERTSGGATDSQVIEAFVRGLVDLPEILTDMAREIGFETVIDWRGGTYAFPGSEELGGIRITRNEGYGGFSWVKGAKAGATLFWVLMKHIERRPSIDTRFGIALKELLVAPDGEVAGVLADNGTDEIYVRARQAVILCTGGFEHNDRLKLHYLELGSAHSAGASGNTGDGIIMAQAVGAALWHMWHLHGTYGFTVPELSVGIRHSFDGRRGDDCAMPWIVVDRFGRRFMNECPPALQDTPIRALAYYDPDLQLFPRVPSWLIFDEAGRKRGPIGVPKFSHEGTEFCWSENNLTEVDKGYIRSAATVGELAAKLSIEPQLLRREVAAWNEACWGKQDTRFHRPISTLIPIVNPPFYAIEVWPIITNTQGGPVHNALQQVLDPFGRPIPRLYAAGELGSLWGHVYALGGNNSECLIGGRIAGEQAAKEYRIDGLSISRGSVSTR